MKNYFDIVTPEEIYRLHHCELFTQELLGNAPPLNVILPVILNYWQDYKKATHYLRKIRADMK